MGKRRKRPNTPTQIKKCPIPPIPYSLLIRTFDSPTVCSGVMRCDQILRPLLSQMRICAGPLAQSLWGVDRANFDLYFYNRFFNVEPCCALCFTVVNFHFERPLLVNSQTRRAGRFDVTVQTPCRPSHSLCKVDTCLCPFRVWSLRKVHLRFIDFHFGATLHRILKIVYPGRLDVMSQTRCRPSDSHYKVATCVCPTGVSSLRNVDVRFGIVNP